MVQIIDHTIGRRIRYADIPPVVVKRFMLRSGMDKSLVNALMEMLSSIRKNEGALITDAVLRVTGHPPLAFESWVQEHRNDFLA